MDDGDGGGDGKMINGGPEVEMGVVDDDAALFVSPEASNCEKSATKTAGGESGVVGSSIGIEEGVVGAVLVVEVDELLEEEFPSGGSLSLCFEITSTAASPFMKRVSGSS